MGGYGNTGAHLITTTEKCGKRTAAVCGAPAAATAPWRLFRDQFTALGHSGALRLVLWTQPRSGGSVEMRCASESLAALRVKVPPRLNMNDNTKT